MESPLARLFVLKGFPCGIMLHVIAAVLFLLITPWYLAIGLTLLFFSYFGILGLREVPIAWLGVPLFLGSRVRAFQVTEGWNWLLPGPFMGIEAVDGRERTTIVSNFTAISKDGVRLSVDAAVHWRIVDPYRSLSIGEEVIERGMVELVRTVIRTSVRRFTVDEALNAYSELSGQLDTQANEKAREWGLDIRNVVVSEISLPEQVIQDSERRVREEYQRQAERIEAEHVREQIGAFMKELGLTVNEAKELFQTERGKVEKKIQEFKLSLEPGFQQAVERAIRDLLAAK